MITETKNFWYSLDKKEVASELKSDLKNGLSLKQIKINQEKYGKNLIEKEGSLTFTAKLISHLKAPLNIILFVAGFTALFLGHFIDAFVVFVAGLINLIIGIFQEDRADKAFEKLNSAQKKLTTVIREGERKLVPVEFLVAGDLVVLSAGDYIPADIRLVEAKGLLINESVLTGEWIGVNKNAKVIREQGLKKGDQANMIWMGTSISGGYCSGLVVSVGSNTELGDISKNLVGAQRETPLKKKINRLVRFISILVFFATILIFFLGILKGETYADMFLVAIAVAIAVIPEGLPIATTSVLAVGMSAILKKGGLVKNLLASETLGNVSVILTDKTGTITEAKMRLANIFSLSNKEEDENEILKTAVLSSDAFLEKDEKGMMIVQGRPLEKEIVSAGLNRGISQEGLNKESQRIDFSPFSSERGFAISLNSDSKMYFGGNPEKILELSKYVFVNGKQKKISEKDKKFFIRILSERANLGMRLTGVAYKKAKGNKITNESLRDLIFAGLLAFDDPIREEVKESLKTTKEMGVRTIMLTGDNGGTARKIAEEVGIIEKGGWVLLGEDIDRMSDTELTEALIKVNVFARMSPSQKLRVSKLLKEAGEIIAMTGDGINDAPALRNANVGIAVGSGTEVAKEAADLILLDNSFSVIVFAIEEGRRIIDNLKKIVTYLLSTNFSEVAVVGGSLLFGLPLPVLATQILWINIVEEGFMNFAFVFEPREKNFNNHELKKINAEILTPNLQKMILLIATITGIILITFYYVLLKLNLPMEEIRTLMFIALSIDSLTFSLSLKSLYQPIWKINLFSNKYLLFALGSSFLLILASVYLPILQIIFSTVPLKSLDFIILFGLALFNLTLIEWAKYFFFQRRRLNAE
ncbi:MAG: HAD-IC family P-type ATPase [Patescibacteria group bacterium]